MKKLSMPPFRFVLRWLMAVLLLVLVARVVPVGDIHLSLSGADLSWFWAGLLLSFGAHAAQAVRLLVLTRSAGLGWRYLPLLEVQFISLCFGLFLPGGNLAAMAVRVYRIGCSQGQWGMAGMVLLVDRVVSLMALELTGLACYAVIDHAGLGPVAYLLALVALATAVALCLIVSGPARLRGLMLRAENPPRLSWAAVGQAISLSLLINILGIAMFWMAARSLGLSLGFLDIGFGRAAMLTAAVLPVSVAGLGLREGAAAWVLGGMGQSHGAAVALSLLVFVLTWLIPGAIGAVIAALDVLRHGRDGN